MRERRRKHDDLHRPLGGKGKRTTLPKRLAPAKAMLVANPTHECKPDAIDDEDHAQCTVCGAWMFLNCNGCWQRSME